MSRITGEALRLWRRSRQPQVLMTTQDRKPDTSEMETQKYPAVLAPAMTPTTDPIRINTPRTTPTFHRFSTNTTILADLYGAVFESAALFQKLPNRFYINATRLPELRKQYREITGARYFGFVQLAMNRYIAVCIEEQLPTLLALAIGNISADEIIAVFE
jgi:hypothetical protein